MLLLIFQILSMSSKNSKKQHITYSKKGLDNKTLKLLYKNMLKPRMIEEKMLILLRQGKISKWFSGIGQEAISVGVAMALKKEECFEYLDAPVKRVASLETPIPFINQLAEQYLPKNRFEAELKALLEY